MRLISLIPALVALFVSGTASAQSWEEYVNRGDFLSANFPGEPTEQEITYKTAKGTSLPAHVYTAQVFPWPLFHHGGGLQFRFAG